MPHALIIVIILFVIPYCTADSMIQLDKENSLFRILLKRIVVLEENVRESNKKLEEIPLLKRRLDDAERRLAYMQDLQHRLEKSEEKYLRVGKTGLNKMNLDESPDSSNSSTLSISESDVTKEVRALDSESANASLQSSVSTILFSQAEEKDNVENVVLLKNYSQGAIMIEKKTEKRSTPSRVAFTAMFTSTPIQLTPGRSLLFDRVDYNEGNAYDKTSGIMTCPITGTYFFYTNILNAPDVIAATEIMHEGIGKGRTYGNSHYDQGSFSATLHCRAGERVWVRVSYGSLIYGGDHSSFSGFLLWADTDTSISS